MIEHSALPFGKLSSVRLEGREGNSLVLRLSGYQFPDAEDPRERFSWHIVEGEATCAAGVWKLAFPALCCDESSRVSSWLRAVAETAAADVATQGRDSHPAALSFTEPNLSFNVHHVGGGEVALMVGLDLEFRPPWDRRVGAGDPFGLSLLVDVDQLIRAADDWDVDLSMYPDGLAN